MLIEVKGYIDFEPTHYTKKHKSQSTWKRVAMIRTNCDMFEYYAWFISKRFNIQFIKPIRRTHVTFISDRVNNEIFEEASKMFNKKSITFYLDLEPRSNGEHWWLTAYCPVADAIRESIGLSKDPYFGLHMTIGHVNEKNIAHSEYILRQCKNFNLINYYQRLSGEELQTQINESYRFSI